MGVQYNVRQETDGYDSSPARVREPVDVILVPALFRMHLLAGYVLSERGLHPGATVAIAGVALPFAARAPARPTQLRGDGNHSSCMRRDAPDVEANGLQPADRTFHTLRVAETAGWESRQRGRTPGEDSCILLRTTSRTGPTDCRTVSPSRHP